MPVRTRHLRFGEALRLELPLLLYLTCVIALLGLFASILYGMTRPTVIANVGVAGYRALGSPNLFMHQSDSAAETMERAAIDAAQAENQEQGIEPLKAFASAEPTAVSGRFKTNGAALLHAKEETHKLKHIANRNTVPDSRPSPRKLPRSAWAQQRRWNGRFGTTDSRSLWTCQC